MRRLPLIILAFLSLTVSCSRGDRELAADFLLADSLMEANPDSGLAYLRGLEGQAEKSSKAYRYRYQLLLAKAMNKAYVPFTSDSVMKDVARYYDRHGSPNERMMAHYLLGCVYRDLDSLPHALLQYETAISQADTTSEDCDFKTLGRIYGQAVGILWDIQQPEDQLRYSKFAHKYALKAKDTLMAISAYEDLADAYETLNMLDSEIVISENASKMYAEYGDKKRAASSLGIIIDNYVARNDFANAKRCMDIYENGSGIFDSKGNIASGHELYYYYKGIYYIGISKTDSASYYLRKLQRKPNPSLTESSAAAKGLYELFLKLGDRDSSLKYASVLNCLKDSSLRLQMAWGTSRVNAIYKYNRAQERANQKELRAAKFKYALCFTLALSLSVIAFLLYISNRKNKQLWKDRLISERNQVLLAQAQAELAKTKNDLCLLQARSEEDKARLIEQKQQQVILLQEKINQFTKLHDKVEVENRIFNAPITDKLHALAIKSIEKPSLQDWHALREMMEKEIPSFHATLNQREPLQQDEYDMCVLIRLRFRPTDIAKLLGISKANVTTKRSRMLKKITGKEGTAKDLDHFLWEIY
jgi:DNA-binding CsgD family transcriptional regulator